MFFFSFLQGLHTQKLYKHILGFVRVERVKLLCIG